MKILEWMSTAMWVVALALALAFASSLEPTAPGMVMIALAVALLFACAAGPSGKKSWCLGVVVSGAVAYAGWRAWTSPVGDYGRSDLLLIACGAMACLWSGWLANPSVQRRAAWGIAALAIANVVVGAIQLRNPEFTPFYAGRETDAFPSGFYGHYNHFANFLLAAGFLAAAGALLGKGRFKKVLWALVALACIAGIAMSRSRGAMLGVGAGTAVLSLCWLLDLKRRQVKWFGVAAISVLLALPVLGLGGMWGAKRVLGERFTSEGVYTIQDSGRLNFASVAVEIANDEALTGGGSRSFTYKMFKRWDPVQLWTGSGDVDFVHNEFLQTATDYGWIGLAVLVGLLIVVIIRGLVVLAVEPESGHPEPDGALTVGALAATTAVGVQGMFSFVFHMAPDVIVLGFLIGVIASQPWPFVRAGGEKRRWLRPAVVGGVLLGLCGAGFAWPDAKAWWVAARPGSPGLSAHLETRYEALADAVEIRPDFRLHHQAAATASALMNHQDQVEGDPWATLTFKHLQAALERNPYHYADRVNIARMLDLFGNYVSAEEQYRVLIPMMDVREMYYKTRFAYGSHAFRRAYALFYERRASEALAWAIEGRAQMLKSKELSWFRSDSPEGRELKRIEEFIHKLEEAHYEPEPNVVPPLGNSPLGN